MDTLTYFRPRPPVVGQTDPAACWAAALSAWLQTTPNRPRWSQADLMAKFDHRDNLGIDPRRIVSPDGGLNMQHGFPHLAEMFSMRWEYLPDVGKLTAPYICSKLRQKGTLCLAYAFPGKSWAHMVVLYGIKDTQKGSIYELYIMDPEPEAAGSLVVRPLTYFEQNRGLFGRGLTVAWPA